MKTKYFLLLAVLTALAIFAVAGTPTGGDPESIAADPTQPAAEEAVNADEERTEEMTQSSLVGVRWVLVSYMDAAGEMVDALPDQEATAEFAADGKMGGNGSCNQYFASYTVDGDNLTISQAGSTMMACTDEGVMEQEAAFLAALQTAATFAIDGEQMQIMNGDGETVLTFVAGQSASLTGTNWTAGSVNNGREAVSTLVAGTTITAVFTEDGKLNGSAGCNNYMTSYTLDGQNITIQPPASTRKLCPEPAGVMEQEAAFLTMLPQAATYTISGDALELRTADGALIVSFTAEK